MAWTANNTSPPTAVSLYGICREMSPDTHSLNFFPWYSGSFGSLGQAISTATPINAQPAPVTRARFPLSFNLPLIAYEQHWYTKHLSILVRGCFRIPWLLKTPPSPSG